MTNPFPSRSTSVHPDRGGHVAILPRSKNRRGFTLVEILVVLAIMALLLAGATVGLSNMTASNGLTRAGYQVQGLCSMARQNSISKNRMTAVIILTGTAGTDVAYRTMTILDTGLTSDGTASATPTWTQAFRWEILPKGVIIDNQSTSLVVNSTDYTSFVTQGGTNSTSIYPNLPPIIYNGVTYTPGTGTGATYAFEIFDSTGGLNTLAPTPCILTLTTGFYAPGSQVPTYTFKGQPAVGNAYSDFFSLFFNNDTGQTKVIRP